MSTLKPPDKELLALYDRLIATHPQIERRGANMPYTSHNGNMFTFLSKEGEVALRLPASERDLLIKKFGATPTVSYGAAMKEYVSLPVALLRQTTKAKPFLSKSLAYAESLKPKATARQTSTAAAKSKDTKSKTARSAKKASSKKKHSAKVQTSAKKSARKKSTRKQSTRKKSARKNSK